MRGKIIAGLGLGIIGSSRRKLSRGVPPTQTIKQGLEHLEPRILLSASTTNGIHIEPVSTVGVEILESEADTGADYQVLPQYDNTYRELISNDRNEYIGHVIESNPVGLPLVTSPTPISFSPTEPKIAGSYYGHDVGSFQHATDFDEYTALLEAGQSIRIEGVPDLNVALAVQVIDPSGTPILSAASSTTGGAVITQAATTPTDGSYLIRISSMGSLGLYRLNAYINEAIEDEIAIGLSNDDTSSAQSLDDYFLDIGAGLQKAAVRGAEAIYTAKGHPAIAYELNESFESGVLPTGWTTQSTTGGRIQVTDAEGASHGTYALLMDNTRSGFALNEAIWTVDLTDGRPTFLSFDYAEWKDSEQNLPTTYTGSYNGDGVSISDDGVQWHRIFPAWNTGQFTRWESTTIDLHGAANAAGITLGPDFKIKFQQYDFNTIPSDGRGYDNITLSVTGDVPIVSPHVDFYKFKLNAEQVASFFLQANTNYANVSFKLLGPAGNIVHTGSGNYSRAEMLDFKAPVAGEYTIQITGSGDDYVLTVIKGGTINGTNNGLTSDYKSLNLTGKAYGHGSRDFFRITAQAGDFIEVITGSPDDGVSNLNYQDPYLYLMGPNGGTAFAVDHDSAPDGRNAYLTYTVQESGDFLLGIYGSGIYTITATGFSGLQDDTFEVESSTYSEGEYADSAFDSITLYLDDPILSPSLDSSDLTLNGIPATGVYLKGPTGITGEIEFDIPLSAYVEGANTLIIPSGSFRSVNGKLIEQTVINFTLDTTPPTVVYSSLMPGEIVHADELTVTVRFSEPIVSTLLAAGDHTALNSNALETAVDYNNITHELTASYSSLIEGAYTFRIDDRVSGSTIRDLAGNQFDGEANLDGGVPSGNGVAGGDLQISFYIEDDAVQPLPADLTPVVSPGTFAYKGQFSGQSHFVGDEDLYRLDLEAGGLLTMSMNDTPGVIETEIELIDPFGSLVASAEGTDPIINAFAINHTGAHTLLVRTVARSTETEEYYHGSIYLNATSELEQIGGQDNNSLSNAQDLNTVLYPLGDGIEQAVILGGLQSESTGYYDSFESGSFSEDWQVFTDGGGRTSVRSFPGGIGVIGPGSGDGIYSMYMDSAAGHGSNAAIWTVNLNQYTNAEFSFYHANWFDTVEPPATDHVGLFAGDGIAISDDGENWHTIFVGTSTTRYEWDYITIDLAQAAIDAGMAFSPDFKIKFSQTGAGSYFQGGQGYDGIQITGFIGLPVDTYKIVLNPSEELSVVLDGGSNVGSVDLLDPSGNLIETGVLDAESNSISIHDVTAEYAGEYYIRLNAVTAPYTLITTTGASFIPEPLIEPIMIDPGPEGSVVSSIFTASEIDTYTFQADAGSRYRLWTKTPDIASPNSLDTYLELYDQSGQLVAESGNGGEGLNALLMVTTSEAGNYTVKLMAEAQTDGSDPSVGGYVFTISYLSGLLGDLTGDGFIGIQDLTIVLNHWNQAVPPGSFSQGDVTGDGLVGILDLTAVLGNWNATLDPPTVEGDLDNDGFVGIADLNIILGNWNLSVTPGDLTQGDLTNDGFVGIGDLNKVLGNWNSSMPSLFLTGDLDSDGFVGITDLNILLGIWNQSVPPSDPLADPSGDGFVGIDDLNAVLSNWNAGTPPTVMTVSASASETTLTSDTHQTDKNVISESYQLARHRRVNRQPSVTNTDSVLPSDQRTSLAAWNLQILRGGPQAFPTYVPIALEQEDEPLGLNIWED